MKNYTISFQNFGRGFRAPTEPVLQSDLLVWEKACNILSDFSYPVESGSINITVDWSAALEDAKYSYLVESKLTSLSWEDFSEWEKLQPEKSENIAINVKVSAKEEGDLSLYIYRALYESFMALNFSSPGSFCFYKTIPDFKTSWDITAESYFFDNSWLECIDFGWPNISYIDLEKVIEWIRNQSINIEELAKTKMQRAVYALLHACCHSPRNLSTIIWLSYALEAIYETPMGQAFSVLYNRLIAFLNPPKEIHKEIKRKLRAFYDERHKFAHGHSPIVHPLEDFNIDSDPDKYLYKVQRLNDFLFTIILATIQKCILNSWVSINFTENWEGIKLTKQINSDR
jgi:hypothetical protein